MLRESRCKCINRNDSVFAKVCFSYCSTSRLAPPRFTRLFGWLFVTMPKNFIKNLIMLYFWKALLGSKDIKIYILDCQIYNYTNTNSQIDKYSLWQSVGNAQHVLNLWIAGGSRILKHGNPKIPSIWDDDDDDDDALWWWWWWINLTNLMLI